MSAGVGGRSYRAFVADNATVVVGHVFVYLRGLVVMPIVIKSVGVATYGGYVLLVSMFSIAFGLSSLGTGITARRYLPSAETMERRAELFYPQFVFNVFTILLLSAGFATIGYRLLTGHGIVFSRWVPALYLFAYLAYSQGTDYFRYTGRVHYMTLGNLCYPYLEILLVLVFLYAFHGLSLNLLATSTSLAGAVVAAPIAVVVLRELGPRLHVYRTPALLSDLRLGFPLVLNNVLDFTLAASDRYLIALYMTVTDVGYYVPAYVLGSLIIFVPKALGTAAPQLLSRAVDDGRDEEARTMFDYTIKIFLLLAIPFVFGCVTLGRPILALLANEQVAERGALVAPLVALGTLFYGLTLLLSSALFVRLQTRAMFHVNVAAAVSNVLANVVLLFLFRSIVVAALTTLFSYLVAFVYAHVAVSRHWAVDYGAASIVKAIAAASLMAAAVALSASRLGSPGPVAVAGLAVLGMTVYVAGLLALRTFSSREMMFLRRLVA